MDKKNLVILTLVFFLAGVGVVSLSKGKEIKKLNLQIDKANTRLALLDKENNKERKMLACLDQAQATYTERWNSTCQDRGEKLDEEGSCLLPAVIAQSMDVSLKNAQDLCISLYK